MGTRATAADVALEARDVLPLLAPLTRARVPGHLLHNRATSFCLPGLGVLAERVASRCSASRRSLLVLVVSRQPCEEHVRPHCYRRSTRLRLAAAEWLTGGFRWH